MSILDALRVNQYKADLEAERAKSASLVGEAQHLKDQLAATGGLEHSELVQAIATLTTSRDDLRKQVEEETQSYRRKGEQDAEAAQKKAALEDELNLRIAHGRQNEIAELDRQIALRRADLVQVDEGLSLQTFGFYKPTLELRHSEEYKNHLDKIRGNQSQMIKSGKATIVPTDWTVNGSKTEGSRFTKDFSQLLIRSFNNECDVCVADVNFHNIEASRKRISKAFEILNKLGRTAKISLTAPFLSLKLDELDVAFGYQLKKQAEREELKHQREEQREAAKLAREIEEAKARIGKEKKHFQKALEDVSRQIAAATGDSDRQELEAKRAEIQNRLGGLAKDEQDVFNREQNTRAGYVYVISNLGSFGENVYKIGVTRRLDPTERVDELGGASVPFDFDTHAMIFSDDAPSLETALHRAFVDRRLNLQDNRKEFYHVSIEEIEQAIKRNFSKTAEVVHLAEAAEYRQSIAQRDGRTAAASVSA